LALIGIKVREIYAGGRNVATSAADPKKHTNSNDAAQCQEAQNTQ
jgi:hypothetical protein